jgi:penicillin amidase
VATEDPDGPMTIPRGYRYQEKPTFARADEANSRRALENDARLSLETEEPERSAPVAANVPADARGTLEQLALVPDPQEALKESEWFRRGMEWLGRVFKFGSNAQIAGPKLSETKNSIQTGGPQVGYLLPQWLSDFGMHGGNIDVTGMTFAGAGPAVLIGRGEGYAWTTTTGSSDLADTFVEKLNPEPPEEGHEYLFNGKYEPMECRVEEYTFRGVVFDEQEICRTRHGPVLAFDEENQRAYSIRYSWFNRENQTVEGFFRYQTVTNMRDFATYSNYLSSNHNMFYTDDRGNFGFWHPGNHVVRAKGVDLRLPQDGTGGSEWRGLLRIRKIPHAVNLKRGWLGNWNNQPAPGWKRERAYSVIDNAHDLYDALSPKGRAPRDPFGGVLNPDDKLDFEDMSGNLRYAAFKHHGDAYFTPLLPKGKLNPIATKARQAVRGWNGFLTDNNDDGDYDSAGPTILNAWLSTMETDLFTEVLGEELAGWGDQNLMWHVLAKNDRRELGFDWLGDRLRNSFLKTTFQKTVTALATEFDNTQPGTWKTAAEKEHYQRLNADTFTDIAAGETFGNDSDTGFPGDVTDHIAMDRGTYNHIVAYQGAPRGRELGNVPTKAGSVIPPGQSGFISPAGQEDEHYEDQWELYVEWRYKPMPLTLSEALRLAESDETIEWDRS